MATNCLDKILCENAWDCNITVADMDGNPINPQHVLNGDDIVFILNDKPGYRFQEWVDENGNPVRWSRSELGENYYVIYDVDCGTQYYAKYCAINYTITCTSSSECFSTFVTNARYGSIITISAPERTGCHFVRWTRDGQVVTEEPSFEHVVTEDVTFVAEYDTLLFRIIAKPSNPDMGVCTGSGYYEMGETVQLTASANNGYSFYGWDDGEGQADRTVTVNGNKTYIAKFGKENNIVTVPSVSGGNGIGSGTYTTGETVVLQAVPQKGWVFSHWVVGGETISQPNYTFIATGNVTATPYFTPQTYSVNLTASPNGYGYFNPSPSSSYSYGDTITAEAVPYTGYRFVGWGDGFEQARRTMNVTSNIELTAIFATELTTQTITVELPDNTYTCDVYYNGVNIGAQNGNQVVFNATEGSIVTISPLVPQGQEVTTIVEHVDGESDRTLWNGENTAGKPQVVYVVGSSDATISVYYQSINYNLRVTATPLNNDTSGNITIDFTWIVDGDSQNYSFVPTQGTPSIIYTEIWSIDELELSAPATVGNYRFAYWSTGVASYPSNTISFSISANTVCTAVYMLNANV